MSVSEQMALADVKNRLSEVVDQIAREHGRVVITKHGHPVAKLVPTDERDEAQIVAAVERLKGFRGALNGLTVDEVTAARREGQRSPAAEAPTIKTRTSLMP